MEDDRTREQLLNELSETRKKLAELEKMDSDRKRVEEAPRMSRELFDTIIEEAPT